MFYFNLALIHVSIKYLNTIKTVSSYTILQGLIEYITDFNIITLSNKSLQIKLIQK